MSRESLKPFSYVVMALIGDGGAGAHDIAAWMAEGRIYWASAPSQWYAEPKRLETLGYLKSRKAPGKTKPRTYYSLTASGRTALKNWLASPARFPRIQNEAAIRLLAGDLIEDSTVIESMRGMLTEVEEFEQSISKALSRVSQVQHRQVYLTLCHSWARQLLTLHRQWIAEVEKTLLQERAAKSGD